MSLRIAVGGLFHETNTFVTRPTRWDDFAAETTGGDALIQRFDGTRTSVGGALAGLRRMGVDAPVACTYASATPSGMVERATWERLAGMILADLRAALPLEGVLLVLHGAMVADGEEDPEGTLLARVRELLGPDVPVVATLDLHSNTSPAMVANASFLVGYDTYPHEDAYDRAVEAAELLVRCVRREIVPAAALVHLRLLLAPQVMYTAQEPFAGLMAAAHRWEDMPGMVNVTVAGGFAYADVPTAGFSVLATANGDPQLARRAAEDIAARARGQAGAWCVPQVALEAAVTMAVDHGRAGGRGAAILVDSSDNIGGGSPGDGTHVLRQLVALREPVPALITICDPAAVGAARKAGAGSEFALAVGGRIEPALGKPVTIRGQVRCLHDGEYVHQGPYMPGQRGHMGPTAVVDTPEGLTVVLTSLPTPPWDAQYVRVLGIDPADYRIIAVKAALAWRTAFGPYAGPVIDVDTPGPTSANLDYFTFRRAGARSEGITP